MRRRFPWKKLLFLLSALCLFVPAALARPGGGHSYGGGSSHGGGSGGGSGELVFFFLRIWLDIVIHYPAFGVPATIVLVTVVVLVHRANRSRPVQFDLGTPSPPPRRGSGNLSTITKFDPDFSAVTFRDFAYNLFARAHGARHDPAKLDELAPYLSNIARSHLKSRKPPGQVMEGVVIGTFRIISVNLPHTPSPQAKLTVVIEFEANMTSGDTLTQYVRERWTLGRLASVKSRKPEAVRDFGCPKCGAPFESDDGNKCSYCGTIVSHGRFDWTVERILLLALETRPPSLRQTVKERGTNLPTRYQPGVKEKLAAFFSEDEELTREGFEKRLGLIYHELNQAWTTLDMTGARPYVSDGLYDYLRYWIDAYRRQGLRNVLDGFRILRLEFAKVTRDRYFDAVTVRLFATGKDSTVDVKTSRVVAGNAKYDRRYSEYWTLIRSAGRKGEAVADKQCPNCGAALDINMAGECAYCKAKITTGDFDWVLSTIEQDDSYSG